MQPRPGRIAISCDKPPGGSAKDPCVFIGTRKHLLKWGKEVEIEVPVDPPATALTVRVYTPDEFESETAVASALVTVAPGQKRSLMYRRSGWLSFLPFFRSTIMELTSLE